MSVSSMSLVALLEALLSHGWRLGYEERITYLPLGDTEDAFDWQSVPTERGAHVLDVARQKERAGERIGVELTWRDSLIGGLFHFERGASRDELYIWTIWNANRPTLGGCDWLTDHGWFVQRISSPLLAYGEISQLVCSDVY